MAAFSKFQINRLWGKNFFCKVAAGCFVAVIKAYQLLISPFKPPCCRFIPSCSEYTKQAILSHGVMAGGWLACKRICRCQPFAKWGYDPVPEKPLTNFNLKEE